MSEKNAPVKHVLGIHGTGKLNPKTEDVEYDYLIVDQSVLDWLNGHDVEFTDRREKLYVVNNIKYLYLGVYHTPTDGKPLMEGTPADEEPVKKEAKEG